MAEGHGSLLAVVSLGLLSYLIWKLSSSSYSASNPRYTFNGPFATLRVKFQFLKRAPDLLRDGYHKFGRKNFEIATFMGPKVIVCSESGISELLESHISKLSFPAWTEDILGMQTQLPGFVQNGHYSREALAGFALVKGKLVTGIKRQVPSLDDELRHALGEELVVEGNEWKRFKLHALFYNIVGRVMNRTMVSRPTCRNKEFLEAVFDHHRALRVGGLALKLTPSFLRPWGKNFLSRVWGPRRILTRYFGELVVPRLAEMRKYSRAEEWAERPDDFLQWLLELHYYRQRMDLDALYSVLIATSFTAVNSTASALTELFLDLATRPEYIDPLREEIIDCLKEDGWTEKALEKMIRLDSFMKESQRVNPVIHITMNRIAMEDYTFSDGTTVRAGQHVGAAQTGITHDPHYFKNPYKFEGFRFSERRLAGGHGIAFTDTGNSASSFGFGGGKTICIGRYFASMIMKLVVSHILLDYDIKIATERPDRKSFQEHAIPSKQTEILLRRREEGSEDVL